MMTPQRQPHGKIYFFEIFTVVNFLIMLVFVSDHRATVWAWLDQVLGFGWSLVWQLLGGLVIRSGVAVVRRDFRYFRVIRTWGWITDTLRLLAASALAIFTYSFIKVMVPVYHPRLFDQELWDLDRMLFFGLSPSIFFLDLFSPGWILKFFDWSYANIFYASVAVGFGYFLSAPSRRLRVAFANGNLTLWLLGTWLYMLVPSLGPAFRFFDVWIPHSDSLRITQGFQAMLMRNYQNVIRAASGQGNPPINVLFGIAAFPSLHVAFQTFVFLWMRRLWTWGEVMFAVFAALIFLGSMITGWHYLVDGLAGIVMALACYYGAARASRFARWTRLSGALARAGK